MKLSKRIYKLADMVQQGETVADIGTDHGYVPMILIKNGISPGAIMSDISEASLSKARETFRIAKLGENCCDFRTGDGLETIHESEVDDVIIAGLGAYTIVDILSADEAKSKSFKRLILQPRKHSGALRYYLYTHGWDITADTLATEGKFQCEIISAVPADDHRAELYPPDDIRWVYPSMMAESEPELAAKRISWKLSSIREQIDNMKRAGTQNEELIERLNSDIEYLEKLIK